MQNEKRDLGVIIIEKGKKNGVFTVAQHTIFFFLKKKHFILLGSNWLPILINLLTNDKIKRNKSKGKRKKKVAFSKLMQKVHITLTF